MNHYLENPVYDALCTGEAYQNLGTGTVRFFDEQVSPFVGFPHDYNEGFADLFAQLPAQRKILYATPQPIEEPTGWQMMHQIKGTQFVFAGDPLPGTNSQTILALQANHVEQMVALATLTKPGPFGKRTIEFGNYFGIFEGEQLVSMAGQRLHAGNYTEISAVCTHPDYLGHGFGAALIQHQLRLILRKGQIPFLHVRADNNRAIALYERLGFQPQGAMNFYFLKRK